MREERAELTRQLCQGQEQATQFHDRMEILTQEASLNAQGQRWLEMARRVSLRLQLTHLAGAFDLFVTRVSECRAGMLE